MLDTYYTRQAEDIYGREAVEATGSYFGNEAVTEAFFSAAAQIDMLVDEAEVNVWEAEFRDIPEHEWTLEKILLAAEEITALAHAQKSPAWPAIASFAACMRTMVHSAPIAPSETFVEMMKKNEKVAPGVFAIAEREDMRPMDLLVATVAEELGPGTATAAAVASERETCISFVEAQIEKEIGEGKRTEDLEREKEDLECQIVELEGDLAIDDEDAAAVEIDRESIEGRLKDLRDSVRVLETRLHAAELLGEVREAIVARRLPEPDSSPAPEAAS